MQETLTCIDAFDDVTILVPLVGRRRRPAGQWPFCTPTGSMTPGRRATRPGRSTWTPTRAHAALYHPWLVLSEDGAEPVPPVGALAGVWCRTEGERGVWKAPANVTVHGGARPSRAVPDTELGEAHPVDVLRECTGQGTIVRGTRTLNESDERWKYIPERRLADMVERDLRQALASAAFEPNSQPTWEQLRTAADNHLRALWRRGGLQGAKPQEAHFV
ncbi:MULTISPECIES: phage tail sheath C-terminal domain-containing protein [Streptomyces]|uniref:phage tail sheath C-terminal domain-containing protein n=1 Tax=Streptomyces TaxID=1883 RepID=UPI000D149F10|nr:MULTISPECIES: phage tail sheath C-terminal domain-containing protein [Streptomyces]